MPKLDLDFMPACAVETCAMRNSSGNCTALTESDFGGKPCPFYKTEGQDAADYESAYNRLLETGREDLIRKYHVKDPARWRKKRGDACV